jgi:hypothetical protein
VKADGNSSATFLQHHNEPRFFENSTQTTKMFSPQFHVLSDLHLETPVAQPSYKQAKIDLRAGNLSLFGDIGLIKDYGPFEFFRRILKKSADVKIFYIGNYNALGAAPEFSRIMFEGAGEC